MKRGQTDGHRDSMKDSAKGRFFEIWLAFYSHFILYWSKTQNSSLFEQDIVYVCYFVLDLKPFISGAQMNSKVAVVDLYNEGYLQLFTCKCKSPPNYLPQHQVLVLVILTNLLINNCL